MFEDDDKIDRAIAPWYNRVMGAAAAIGAIVGFYNNFLEIHLFLIGRLLSAASGALGGVFLTSLLFIPIWIFTGAFKAAAEHDDPFIQGLKFVVFILVGVALFDFLLLGGQFVVMPTIWLVTTGSFGSTYWGCEDWISVEGGSYCAD